MKGPWVGFMQRLLTTTISVWLILVALRSHKIASAAAIVDDENSSVMEKQLSDRVGEPRRVALTAPAPMPS